MSKLDYVFGTRHKDTNEGEWNKCFVAIKNNKMRVISYFDNYSDYIGYNPEEEKVFEHYIDLMNKDYMRMSLFDIMLTTGVQQNEIDKRTLLDFDEVYIEHKYQKKIKKYKYILYFCLFGIFYIFCCWFSNYISCL
jgi:hypothetical protein